MKILNLHGTVIDSYDSWFYNLLDIENINAKAVSDFLSQANGEDVLLSINSGGGSVNAGSEIYTMLMNYQGKISAEVTGICASIASVIMLAAEHISVSPAATIMIHNVWSNTQGDYRDMAKSSDILKEMSSSIAKMYAKRMNISVEEAQTAMDQATYYSADQAVDAGIADEKLFENAETPLQLVASVEPVFSSEKIAKLKSFMMKQIKNEADNVQTVTIDSDQFQEITDRLDQIISQNEQKCPNCGSTNSPVACPDCGNDTCCPDCGYCSSCGMKTMKNAQNSAEKPLKNQKFKPIFLGGIK